MPARVASGVYRVDAVGFSNAISVLLIEGGDGWTLVDTGIGPSAGRIREALLALGKRPEYLKRIFLTHHHSDHVGGLPSVQKWAPNAELIAPEREAEVISGKRHPDPSSNALLRYLSHHQKLPTATVDAVVLEGDTVAGFRVIFTPGHTLGHASLLRDKDGTFHRRRVRSFAAQDPGRGTKGVLHEPRGGEALRGEAARGGVRYRGHEPRQTAVRRRTKAPPGSGRPLRLRVVTSKAA